ncbi:ATP-dependent sacrificial sulfur transferase LarE [Vibrio breoganii]|uniref:ATP-dependent sacrificial sulfur transferase LarE n=1 Tax=Vibrio breoganii TaxID=553239 RepID=UPI000C849830|nr:ATP-dependent sacrificial sulfur transferase LarE [Vibrio breoganii]PMO32025.1 TIGR00268 family protein [Vibrio breoganii]
MLKTKVNLLQDYLRQLGKVTVALSGGVDSMTLAYVAHQTLGKNATMVHSISPAVPSKDTERIREHADQYGWELVFVQSGEMEDSHYRENPVNRCYYCKTCLYTRLKSLDHGQVISGTNLDDLDDYRPGLIAAKENDIKHPYVEVGIDKQTIRNIANHFGLDSVARLPASPCLASRVETGIAIKPHQLHLIEDVESILRSNIEATNLRCRVQSGKITIEIDAVALQSLPNLKLEILKQKIQDLVNKANLSVPIHFKPYQKGSAFVGAR